MFNPAVPPEAATKIECEKFCREMSPSWRAFYAAHAEALAAAVNKAGANSSSWKLTDTYLRLLQGKSFRDKLTPIIEDFLVEAAKAQIVPGTPIGGGRAASPERSDQGQSGRETHHAFALPSGSDSPLPADAGDHSVDDPHGTFVSASAGSPSPETSEALQPRKHMSHERGQQKIATQKGHASREQSGGGDLRKVGTHRASVSPPLRKSPPRPTVREPSRRRIELQLQNRVASAEKILYGLRLRIGARNEIDIDIADAPPMGTPAWEKLKARAGEVGARNLITYTFMQELELRRTALPSSHKITRLSDQISQKTAREALLAARDRLQGPRLAMPRELLSDAA